jgi:hypothetical protein
MRRRRIAAVAAAVIGLCVAAPVSAVAAAQPTVGSQQVTTSDDPLVGSPSGAPTSAANEGDEPSPITLVDMSVAALARKPPFFQLPRSPLAISEPDALKVVGSINAAGTPIYIVILPGSAVRAAGTSQEIQQKLGLPGTYLTLIGTVYETYSTEFDSKSILTRAFAEERNNGTTAVLMRFAQLSGQAALGPLPSPDVIAWRPTILVVGGVLVIGFGYLLIRGRQEDEPTQDGPQATPADASV